MPPTSHFRILCFLLTSLILLWGKKAVKPSKMLEIDLLRLISLPNFPRNIWPFFLRRAAFSINAKLTSEGRNYFRGCWEGRAGD